MGKPEWVLVPRADFEDFVRHYEQDDGPRPQWIDDALSRASIPGGVGVTDADLRSFAETVGLIAEGDFYRDYDRAIAAIEPMRRILSALDLSPAEGEPVGLFRKTDGAWKQVPDEWVDHPNVQPLYATPSNPVISDEWQPIETAPKGQRLIVSNGKWFGPAVPLSDSRWFMWCSFFEPWDYERRNERPNCIVPTHWMPLPAAPAALSVKPQSGENG